MNSWLLRLLNKLDGRKPARINFVLNRTNLCETHTWYVTSLDESIHTTYSTHIPSLIDSILESKSIHNCGYVTFVECSQNDEDMTFSLTHRKQYSKGWGFYEFKSESENLKYRDFEIRCWREWYTLGLSENLNYKHYFKFEYTV
jgi:hypothetical protein